MIRYIDADALYEQIAKKEELARQRVLDTPSRMPNGDLNPSAIRYTAQLDERTQMKFMIADAPTIDAVPLDGSFLKMSRGDYLIYKRHWLYEHFDQEIDIQRSAMKSMGYEPALKDTEPHWIPCSERLPEEKGEYLVTYHPCYWDDVKDEIRVGIDTFRGRTTWAKKKHQRVIAWMPLPKPYEVDK